ncbi:P22_AR N-terminal domain-containing protein [Mycolicibacterium neoaurum]|uniref:phage antirepressor N-terminal domain-containing protein n=1 Tax=Mycolicibacterium neoaurum TaxID=1795 RepID=UPI000566F831|nr:phage antirepressor N-terminal domain-containing protein [Mycolicibacterium neoaurum]SDD61472.1 P22_AR N-terminal domain-containing protein [Mycolicibacterium neoaurum]
MATELVHVPVPGADDLLALQDDGQVWVALRPMCDSLGIDLATQVRKLRRRSWAGVSQRPTPSAGGVQQTTVITSDTVPMWLVTIDENRVAEEVKPKLIAYQREARTALDSYFNKRAVVAPAVNQFDVLRAAIDQIEAAQREAAEAKALAQRTDERLAAIEGKHDWLSALAYARINGLPTHTTYLKKVGSCATRIAKAHDILPNKVQHQLYGTVNSYPVWVWDLATEGFNA